MRTTPASTPPIKNLVRSLLYFLELLGQALEVKVDTTFLFPSLLNQATEKDIQSKEIRELIGIGKGIGSHVRTIAKLIRDLGGTAENISLFHERLSPSDIITTFAFQEELAQQILKQGEQVLTSMPESSPRNEKTRLALSGIITETQNHQILLHRIFASSNPHFQHLVLKRFQLVSRP